MLNIEVKTIYNNDLRHQ